MQAGNDFLPSIPSLEIYGRPSGLDVLVRTYKDLLPALGGPITNGSIINPDRLKRILSKLAEDEEDAFQRLAVSLAFYYCAFCIACKRNAYCHKCSHTDACIWQQFMLLMFSRWVLATTSCNMLLSCQTSMALLPSKFKNGESISESVHTRATVGTSPKLCFAVYA